MTATNPNSTESIRERLTGVCRKVFANPSLQLADDMTAAQVDGWDSLTHIDLIVAVERALKVRFTTSEISGLKNVGELVRLVERKLVPK